MVLSRRQFLAGAAVVAVGTRPHRPRHPVPVSAGQDGTALFRAGVASGDPDATSVVLWTRLFPPDAGQPVEVSWEVAASPDFTTVATSGGATATPDHAHTVHAVATLAPGTWYYRFIAGGVTSPVGRTVIAGPSPTSLRLAAASCQHYETGFYAAHRDIAQQQPDLVLWLGDYIYEYSARPVGGPVVRTHDGPEITTLDQYRARYALYKSDPDLQAAHAAAAWLVMWDDHEVENNYAALTPENPADAAGFAARRDAAYQAWWEHTPTRLAPPVAAHEYRVYRGAAWGDLAEFTLLDGRQYRTDQACGDAVLKLDPPCPEIRSPGRTMLGDAQEIFLEDRLAGSTSRWNVIGNQTIMADATINGAVLNYDQWDGYPEARERFFAFLHATAIPNVVVLTGDIHLAAVAQLRQGDSASGPVVGAEFISTSISSSGLVDASFTEILKKFPSLLDAELVHRGYALHTVTPEQWSAEYRIVTDVTDAASTVTTYGTYVVKAGTNTVTVAR